MSARWTTGTARELHTRKCQCNVCAHQRGEFGSVDIPVALELMHIGHTKVARDYERQFHQSIKPNKWLKRLLPFMESCRARKLKKNPALYILQDIQKDHPNLAQTYLEMAANFRERSWGSWTRRGCSNAGLDILPGDIRDYLAKRQEEKFAYHEH